MRQNRRKQNKTKQNKTKTRFLPSVNEDKKVIGIFK
jgi:hypothetical protein